MDARQEQEGTKTQRGKSLEVPRVLITLNRVAFQRIDLSADLKQPPCVTRPEILTAGDACDVFQDLNADIAVVGSSPLGAAFQGARRVAAGVGGVNGNFQAGGRAGGLVRPPVLARRWVEVVIFAIAQEDQDFPSRPRLTNALHGGGQGI